MLEEVLDVMPIHDSGFYIDGTFGRGGHSRALLSRLGPDARLTGIDRDPQAVATGRELERADARFHIMAARFDCIAELAARESRPLVGVLLDLGVSSPQLDDAARGFSFLRDGPLDMRMNPEQGISAAQWLMQADEKTIADVLYQFGEERKSRRIARRICEQRAEAPIETTRQLAELVEKAIGRGEPGKHPATRTFQAIRIHINEELDALQAALAQAVECLAPGGRLAVISFHSLEDRMT
ncbi:MAG: 16S rRNA (cytosine(1402)-N(4))-methyltransferase RsmH, partial [Oleiphilaceae bacterium]|nr:16S rRNA (cytosine(1402)-N(4))-methyltransferase RsmH [Oleiphilaceae bacterium]